MKRLRNYLNNSQHPEPSTHEESLYEHPTLIMQGLHRVLLRIGLLGTAVLAWQAATNLGDGGDTIRQTSSLLLMFILNIMAFSLLILAAFRRVQEQALYLIPATMLVVFLAYAQTDWVNDRQQGSVSSSDVWLFSEYSAQLLLSGENPYEHDMSYSLWVHRSPPTFSTPRIDGDLIANSSYPALAFLLFVPFHLLGISTQFVYPLFALLTYLALFFAAPRMIRPIVLLPFLAEPRYFYFVFGGVNDIVWAFFIVMMIIQWQQPIPRALWFGLACAFKQQAWIFMPFLIIRLWMEHRHEPLQSKLYVLLEAVFNSAVVFLLFNLPFMLINFDAWYMAVMTPLSAPMIILGQGLSSFMLEGIIIFPVDYFTVARYAVLILFILFIVRHYDDWADLIWIAPAVILWFGSRSLVSYWYFYAFPFGVALVRSIWDKPQVGIVTQHYIRRHYRLSFTVLCAAFSVFMLSLVYFAMQPRPINLTLHYPIETTNGTISRLRLTVENDGDKLLQPRFSVRQWGLQPFFWQIESGPTELAPKTQAEYVIYTDYPPFMFWMDRGAQIIVSDAQYYELRDSLVVDGDIALHYYDAIANGDFRYWQYKTPFLWGQIGEGDVSYSEENETLELHTDAASPEHPATLLLDTWAVIPTVPIDVQIYVPAEANYLPDLTLVYGYEIYLPERDTRIWVLFGDEDTQGLLGANWFYWMRETEREEWVNQSLDIQQILADLNIKPVATPILRQQLNYPVAMMNFRLLVFNRLDREARVQFGSVATQSLNADTDKLVQSYLDTPEVFWTWRGTNQLQQTNFDQAIAMFTMALDRNPQYAPTLLGLGDAYHQLENWDTALSYYQAALDYGYYNPAEIYAQMAEIFQVKGDCQQAQQYADYAQSLSSSEAVPLSCP